MKKSTSKARKNRGKKTRSISEAQFNRAKEIATSNMYRLGKAGRYKLYNYIEQETKMISKELIVTENSARASYLMGKLHTFKELIQEFSRWFGIPIEAHFDVEVVIQEGENE